MQAEFIASRLVLLVAIVLSLQTVSSCERNKPIDSSTKQPSGKSNSESVHVNKSEVHQSISREKEPRLQGTFFPSTFSSRSALEQFRVSGHKATVSDLSHRTLLGATIDIGSGGYLPYAAIYQMDARSGEWALIREYFPKLSAMQYHFVKTEQGFMLKRSESSAGSGSIQEVTICEILTNGEIMDSEAPPAQ